MGKEKMPPITPKDAIASLYVKTGPEREALKDIAQRLGKDLKKEPVKKSGKEIGYFIKDKDGNIIEWVSRDMEKLGKESEEINRGIDANIEFEELNGHGQPTH